MKRTKPPIGIVPEWYYNQLRTINLAKAIIRYAEAEQPIPSEWVEEYNRRIKESEAK